jgi:hypothetical protein
MENIKSFKQQDLENIWWRKTGMNKITKTPAAAAAAVSFPEKIYWSVIVILFVISVVPRFYDILKFLPVYSIDENDIVEFAAGFLGGDLDPHWYKYGPLYAYLLAVIYALQSLFSAVPFAEFVEDIFFNPTRFYFTARLVNTLINILIALYTYRLAKKFFTKQVALITLALAIFPFFDILVNYTVRVDTLLALWTILVLFYLLKVQQEQGIRNYLLAGVFWGLSLATKPLPAALLLPTAFLAHWLATAPRLKISEQQTRSKRKNIEKTVKVKNKPALDNFINALINPAFYIFLISGLVVSFIANPYSLINFKEYKMEQIKAVQSEGERNFVAGWDISRFFTLLGYVFTLLAVVVVLYYLYKSVRQKNYLHLTLLSYPLIFWLAFASGAAREYFYVPIIPVLIIFIAQFLVDSSKDHFKFSSGSRRQHIIILTGLLLILVQPLTTLLARTWTVNKTGDYRSSHTALAGKKWIEENISFNSKILLYGYYVNLPHLVDPDPQKQAQFGEYFMYFRWKNKFLTDHFLQAHSVYLQSKLPTYDLANIRDPLREKEAQLYAFGRKNNIEYVVSTYDLTRFPEFGQRLIKKFDTANYPFGIPFGIYKLKDE